MNIERKNAGGDPVAEIKTLIEAQGRAFEEFKAANDSRLKQIETKGSADAVTTGQVDKLNAELTRLGNELKTAQGRLDEAEKKSNRPRHGGGEMSAEASEHKDAFLRYARKSDETGLRDIEQKAMRVGSGADGGYLVPEAVAAEIERLVGIDCALRGLATVIKVGAAGYKKLVNKGGATSGWVGENDTRGSTSTPTMAGIEIPVHEIYAMPGTTQALLDDASYDVEGFLAAEIAIEFAEAEGDAFVNGDGVSKPRGLLSYEMVANASWAHGKIGFIKSGAAGAFVAAANGPGDCLIDLVHSLKKRYRQNGRWLMNDLTEAAVRELKDVDGNYLWRAGLEAGKPNSLLGYGIENDDTMPDIAANSYSIGFGDWKRTYTIVDRMGVRTLRDPLTSKGNVLFYTTKRVGGGITNFEAAKFLKFAA